MMSDSSFGCPITAYPYTVSFWYYFQNVSGGAIFSFGDTSSANLNGLYTASNTTYIYIESSADTISSAYTASQWHHTAIRYTSSTSRTFYVNNSSTAFGTTRTITSNFNRWGLCAFVDSTIANFLPNGPSIAEFAIWDADIESTGVDKLYNRQGTPLNIRPENLVCYCPLNDGAGIARDIVGGRHLDNISSIGYSDAFSISMNYKQRSFMAFKGTSAVAAATYNSIFHGSVF